MAQATQPIVLALNEVNRIFEYPEIAKDFLPLLRYWNEQSKQGDRFDGTFTQDYEYVKGLGDLDECNGRKSVTPDFPQGIYHYVITNRFPFVPRCFRGTPDVSFKVNRPGPGRRGQQRPRRPRPDRPNFDRPQPSGAPPHGSFGHPPHPPGKRPFPPPWGLPPQR